MLNKEEQFAAMVRRLLDMPAASQDALIDGLGAGEDFVSQGVNESLTARTLTDKHSTTTTSTPGTIDTHILTPGDANDIVVRPPKHRVCTAVRDIMLVPVLPHTTSPSPFAVGMLKHLGHALPDVKPEDLENFCTF